MSAADHPLPGVDVRALARRAALPAGAALVAAVAIALGGGPARAFAHALGRALQADPRWVVAGAIFELLSFAGYIALFWAVGSRATPRLRLRASAQVTLGGAAATRLLPTAGVGGAAFTLWVLKRAGLATRDAARALLTFLVLLYAVFLTAILVSGTVLAAGGGHGAPLTLSALPAAAAALVIFAALAAAARRPRPRPVVATPSRTARLAARGRDTFGLLGTAVRDALAVLRSGDPRLAGALLWWGFDAAVLWAVLHAFGAPPHLAVLALAYFVGQVGNTIPIPGAVSGGLVGVLIAFGVQADLALVSVLAYRALAIWLPAPVGLLALRPLRRTIAAWDAPQRVGAAPALGPAPASPRLAAA